MEVETNARPISYICEAHEVILILRERLSPLMPDLKG